VPRSCTAPRASLRWKKRSSDLAAIAVAASLCAATAARAAFTDEEDAALDADVKLYANAYACDEEPLAERLRSTALLIVAGSGKTAADVVVARQRFLDGLRDRARQGGRPTAAGCAQVLSDTRARLQVLETVRLEPPAGR
jgi:hypothetical protein